MGVRVNPNTAVAVAVSFIQPVFAASWLDIQIDAEVTFPDRLAVEVVTPVDAVAKTTVKARTDTIDTPSDEQTLLFAKNTSDTVTMVDQSDITYVIGKLLADLQTISEQAAKNLTKAPIVDSVSMLDNMDGNIEFLLFKAIDEVQSVVDQTSTEAQKGILDSVAFSDAISTLLIFIRSFSESFSVPDTTVYNLEKTLSDILVSLDSQSFIITKPISDEITIPELAAKDFSKEVIGSAQIYVDPTYFLTQDYVNDVVSGDYVYAGLDEILLALIRVKSLADDVQANTTLTFETSPLIADLLAAPDAIQIGATKNLADEINIVDNMDGDLTYQVVKTTGDLQGMYDVHAIALSTQKADNALVDDAGIVVVQDYSDISYFLSDYVGISRAFT